MKRGLAVLLILISPFGFYAQDVAVCGFTNKKVITIQGSQVSGTVTDFPVLIDHTSNDLRSTAFGGNVESTDGFDIIFSDDFAELLDFQLEEYDETTGHIVAWVKVPELTNGTDVDIHMLYGKTTVVTDQSSTDTWDSDFYAVWHMSESPASGSIIDHTAATNDARPFGMNAADLVVGRVGNGLDFDGGNDYLNLGDVLIDGTENITVEAWINPQTLETNATPTGHNTSEGAIIHKNGRSDDNLGLTVSSGGTAFYIDDGGDNLATTAAPVIGTWTHVMATWDNSTMRLYINGSLIATRANVNGAFVNNNNSLHIGGIHGSTGTSHEFHGVIDEVRLSSTARSADWVATSYNSQSDPEGTANSFYEISSEVNNVYTSLANAVERDWDDLTSWTGTPSAVPHVGADITVSNRIDIDGGSKDYIICNCTVISSRSDREPDIDMDDARKLTIIEDLSLINVMNRRPVVTLDDNGTTLNVLGDVYLTNNSGNNATNSTRDVLIDLNNQTFFNVEGSVTMTSNSGRKTELDVSGTSEINIGGNVFLDGNGGDEIELRVDGTAEFNIGGTLTSDLSGTETMIDFNLDGGQMTVTGVSLLERSLDSHEILFDMDGGNFTSLSDMTFNSSGGSSTEGTLFIAVDQGSVFRNESVMIVDMTGADDFRVEVNNGENDNNSEVGQFINVGDITITRSAGGNIGFHVDEENSLINIRGNLSITSLDGGIVLLDLDKRGTIDVDGSVDINYSGGEDCILSLERVSAGIGSTFNVDGDFSFSNLDGDREWLFDLNGGSFIVDGDMTILNSGNDGGESVEFELDNDLIFTVGNDLNLTLEQGDNLHFEIGDNSTSTVQLNIGRDLNMTHTGGDDLFINFRDATTGTIGRNLNMTTTRSTAEGVNNLFYYRLNTTADLVVIGDVNLDIADDETAELDLNANSVLHVGGDFVRNTSPNDYGRLTMEVNATIEYNGSDNLTTQVFAQDEGAGTDFFNYTNVIINNSSTFSPQLTMEGLATVNGDITFTDGIISSTTTNLLVLVDNSDAINESDNSHVDGPVMKIGNDAFDFPIGDNNQLQQLSISAPSVGTDQFTAQYFEVNPNDVTFDTSSHTTEVHKVSGCEYWDLDRTNGSSNVIVTLNYDANSCAGEPDENFLTIVHWDDTDSEWENIVSTPSGNVTFGVVVSDAVVTDFSPFTIGSTGINNPLPIELISFEAFKQDGHVHLEWITASELNNDFYTVERSVDNIHWEEVLVQSGVGNSSKLTSYSGVDLHPLDGDSYYRLKQTDIDGTFTYSRVVSVNWNLADALGFTIFPNPVSQGVINLEFGELSAQNLLIELTDVVGKVYFSNKHEAQNGTVLTVDLNKEMSSGVYSISIKTEDGETYYEKLVIE